MPKRKRNIHILHVVPTLGAGGMELVMSRIVQGLSRQGVTHSVVCLKGEAIISDQFDDSVSIYCMHAKPNELSLPWRLWQLLRRVRPTVIQVLNWSAWPDVAIARLAMPKPPPLIFGFHGLDTSGPILFRRRLASRMLAHITTHMFTVSEATKRMLVHHVGLPENRIDVIPNGIDIDLFCPPNDNALGGNGIVIGAVGSLSPVKNHALLIRACAAVSKSGLQVELRLAGEGLEKSRLSHLSNSLGIADRVHLLGHMKDVPAFLQQLDIFVLPSNSEAHPLALLEAMSSGLPCIATCVGGVPEVLDEGRCGRLVQPGDIEDMANAIRQLSSDRATRAALGIAARARVIEKYSLEQMLERYSVLYGCCNSYFYPDRLKYSPQDQCFKIPRIVMLGPMPPLTGGMATVMNNLRDSSLSKQSQLTILDNGKTTPEGCSLLLGIGSGLKLISRLSIKLLSQCSEIVHIHTCGWFTFWRDCVHLALSRLFRCKVILHIHGAKFDRFIADMAAWQRILLRMALEMASGVIVLSNEWLRKLRPFAPAAHWYVVPNGVIIPQKHKRMADCGHSFLFLGDLSKRKGVYDLISALDLAAKRGFQGMLYIAGGESSSGQRRELEELISRLGVQGQIKLLGIVYGIEKTKVIEEADCFVLPSYAEGLPMALLEAMAYELPVITTDVGGIPELVTDGQEGFLIKPGDVKALADRMIMLSKDKNLRKEMGRAGSRRVEENYGMDVMVERIMKVYREILDEV